MNLKLDRFKLLLIKESCDFPWQSKVEASPPDAGGMGLIPDQAKISCLRAKKDQSIKQRQ